MVALTESRSSPLRQRRATIGVSVLRPGLVRRRLMAAARHRPPASATAVEPAAAARGGAAQPGYHAYVATDGMAAAPVAAIVREAIRAEQVYILTHRATPKYLAGVRTRAEPILAGANPPLRPRFVYGGRDRTR